MKNSQSIIALLGWVLILIGCAETKEKSESIQNEGWIKDGQVLKTVQNINFTFPDQGYAYENKEDFIKQSLNALKENSELIGIEKFKDTIFIRFLASRDEMFPLTGRKASGTAYEYIKTVFLVSNENSEPPLKHELMHLIAMLDWGYPNHSSVWMNEGLGTFSDNNCNGNNVAEIYRYLLENNRLISMDLFNSDFYGQSEMVGYHQSAYIVEHLLTNYSIEQFKNLWQTGFENFQNIYGVPYSKVKADLEKAVMEKYPKVPEIDWEEFNQGCK